MLYGIIAFVMTLILIAGIHEAGHAWAARWFGVNIERIAIGFGKPLMICKSRSGVEWVLGRLPIGGYVRLLNTRIKLVTASNWSQCFDKQKVWVKCIILAAGAIMNVMLAWVCLTLCYWLGYLQYLPIVLAVNPHSQAQVAGIKAGDLILVIGEKSVSSWQNAGMILVSQLGNTKVLLTVRHSAGNLETVALDLRRNAILPAGSLLESIGIVANNTNPQQVPGQSMSQAIISASQTIVVLLTFFLTMIKQLFLGRIPLFWLMGPIGLLTLTTASFLQGLSAFAYFIALLSLAVGVVNLLPIPGLDGGAIVYALVEKLRGKPISVALEVLLYRLATIALFVFIVQLLGNDLQRLVK